MCEYLDGVHPYSNRPLLIGSMSVPPLNKLNKLNMEAVITQSTLSAKTGNYTNTLMTKELQEDKVLGDVSVIPNTYFFTSVNEIEANKPLEGFNPDDYNIVVSNYIDSKGVQQSSKWLNGRK